MNRGGAREVLAEDVSIASSPVPDPPRTSTPRRTYVRTFVPSHGVRALFISSFFFLVPPRKRVTHTLACSVLRCKQRRGTRTSLHIWFLDHIKDQEPHYPCGPRRNRRRRIVTCPLSKLNLRHTPLTSHGTCQCACGRNEDEGFNFWLFVVWFVVRGTLTSTIHDVGVMYYMGCLSLHKLLTSTHFMTHTGLVGRREGFMNMNNKLQLRYVGVPAITCTCDIPVARAT